LVLFWGGDLPVACQDHHEQTTNDAPVLTVPGAKTVNEDTLLSITGVSAADVDAATGAVKIAMSVAHGRMTLAQTTGLTFTQGDGASDASMTITGTLRRQPSGECRGDGPAGRSGEQRRRDERDQRDSRSRFGHPVHLLNPVYLLALRKRVSVLDGAGEETG
jgi:hypothetical protein